MLDILEKHLNSLNVFENNIPQVVKDIADSIPVNTIPRRMKLTIAMSEIVLFVSQFRRNIEHWNGSIIPINSITFCIAKSGASKDSSIKAARKCFAEGYNQIDIIRKEFAKKLAIQTAKENGEILEAETWNVYGKYYRNPNPLFVAPSTVEGFIQHLNDLEISGIGAGFIYSGEVGHELANSPTLTDNIKLLAELYDEGTKEVKVLKDRNNQSKAIEGLPTSALFVGSQDNLLFDDSIKRKFKTEFTTKLARRSLFIYANDEIEQKEYNNIQELVDAEKQIEVFAINKRKQVITYINKIIKSLENSIGVHVKVSASVVDLFVLYRRYNEEYAKTIDSQFPISILTRTHLQWKALKIAGALALIRGSDIIEIEDYKGAIEFVEMLNKDIINFEKELSKEPYEVFSDYANTNHKDGKLFINLHTIRKMGFISTKGSPKTKMEELIQLVTAYDSEGIYTLKTDGILFEKLIKTEVVGVSFVPVEGTKDERRKMCATGYEYIETTFKELGEMLKEDFAYTPFKFKNGVRGKENLEGTCKWLVLDVDSSNITDKEAHLLLSDINHHIARTSDKDNEFKFRILLELDSEIDLPDIYWKYLIQSVSKEIGIDCDILPKAQIFFSYANRNILSTVDAQPLEIKEHLVYALNKELITEQETKISVSQKKSMLEDSLNTFASAYNAKNGEGSRKMIWAAKYAKELGASKEYVIDLMHEINKYWINPLPEKRFQDTIIAQIKRWNFIT